MKGNITNSLLGKRTIRRNVVIVILFFVLLLLLLNRCSNFSEPKSRQPGVDRIFTGAGTSGDVGYTPASSTSITLYGTNGIVIRQGAERQDVVLSNPSGNNCFLIISIYLGDGTLLYESGSIAPGFTEQIINLLCNLQCGVYRGALMVYRFYDLEDPTIQIGMCEVPIEIQVIY